MSSQNCGITCYPSEITSYPSMHTHLHANQLDPLFNCFFIHASVELWMCYEIIRPNFDI